MTLIFPVLKNDLNELTKLSGNQSVMSDLANQIMRVKWPKSEDPLSVLGFIFDSFHFLSVFILIGKLQVHAKLRLGQKIRNLSPSIH